MDKHITVRDDHNNASEFVDWINRQIGYAAELGDRDAVDGSDIEASGHAFDEMESLRGLFDIGSDILSADAWEPGDILVCTDASKARELTAGGEYVLIELDGDGDPIIDVNEDGDVAAYARHMFRFHARI